MKKALIISGNLVQDHEFIYPYYRLLEEGYNLDVCILEGKSLIDSILKANEKGKIKIKKIEDNNAKDDELLVIPGGVKAMEKIRQNTDIIKFISDFDKEKKIIACICSGAQLLISAKVVKGRKISGYYSMKDDLINAGAIYTDLPAVIDDNIITTAHYKDMGPWMKAVIEKINN